MALFTPSCLISEIRGSVGTSNFSKNAYGPIVRSKLTRIDPNTTKQQLNRLHMQEAVAEWNTISDVDRKEWGLLAKLYPRRNSLGIKHVLSGFNFYISCFLTKRTFTAIDPVITRDLPIYPSIRSINWFDGPFGPQITVDYSTEGFAVVLLVYISIDKPPTVRSLNKSWMYFAEQDVPTSNTRLFPTDDYQSIFGVPFPITEHRRMWLGLKFAQQDMGIPSATQYYEFFTDQYGYILPPQ